MGSNSTKGNLKLIQGGRAEVTKSTKTLTHKNVKEFLANFAEAILVDQERVNNCRVKSFIPYTMTVCGEEIGKTTLALLLICP